MSFFGSTNESWHFSHGSPPEHRIFALWHASQARRNRLVKRACSVSQSDTEADVIAQTPEGG